MSCPTLASCSGLSVGNREGRPLVRLESMYFAMSTLSVKGLERADDVRDGIVPLELIVRYDGEKFSPSTAPIGYHPDCQVDVLKT